MVHESATSVRSMGKGRKEMAPRTGHSAQVHPMPIITEAAKGERHEAGNSSPKRPSFTPPRIRLSNCSHGDTEAGDSGEPRPIEEPDPAGRRMLSVQAKQSLFVIPCFGLKGTGLFISRALTKDPFHSSLVSCAAVLHFGANSFYWQKHGSSRPPVIISKL